MERFAYSFCPPPALRPQGWLRRQLTLQAEGLAGNLDKVWPDVRDSAWIGGDREGWERVPYWLDGFIPLAFLLDDEQLIARAKRYIDAILDRQAADGWMAPCPPEKRGNYDTWAVLLISKVLCVWCQCAAEREKESAKRAEEALYRCLFHLNDFLDKYTLRNWGATRWFEGLVALSWLYERTGGEAWMEQLARKLELQGTDWEKVFSSGILADMNTGWNYLSHVVNIGMMLKSRALMRYFDGGDPNVFAERALDWLLDHHGMAMGHFSGDENISGNTPDRGSELCAVVETMYSYEWLFAAGGNVKWLDLLEKLAYNGLAAAISPDMWSHQYDQMTNQVRCEPTTYKHFRTNGTRAHTFGLEPEFGCCTANFGQGWPKLALSAIMRSGEDVIVCALPLPMRYETLVEGVPVTVEMQTDYPFRDKVIYRVKAERPVLFTLEVRVPGSVQTAILDGREVRAGLWPVRRTWCGEQTVVLDMTFVPTYDKTRPNDMVTLWRGPLLYALPIGEKWTRVEYTDRGVERAYPYCDYAISPTTPWNYAFAGEAGKVTQEDFDLPFDPAKPPMTIEVLMVPIDWHEVDGIATPVPEGRVPLGPVEVKKLIPYGCTNLRMTEMPFVKA